MLETARGGILRSGLGFDRCDVGVVTNVQADHLGLRGIDTLEDLARVKALVVEIVARRTAPACSTPTTRWWSGCASEPGADRFFLDVRRREGPAHLSEHIAEGGMPWLPSAACAAT